MRTHKLFDEDEDKKRRKEKYIEIRQRNLELKEREIAAIDIIISKLKREGKLKRVGR